MHPRGACFSLSSSSSVPLFSSVTDRRQRAAILFALPWFLILLDRACALSSQMDGIDIYDTFCQVSQVPRRGQSTSLMILWHFIGFSPDRLLPPDTKCSDFFYGNIGLLTFWMAFWPHVRSLSIIASCLGPIGYEIPILFRYFDEVSLLPLINRCPPIIGGSHIGMGVLFPSTESRYDQGDQGHFWMKLDVIGALPKLPLQYLSVLDFGIRIWNHQ